MSPARALWTSSLVAVEPTGRPRPDRVDPMFLTSMRHPDAAGSPAVRPIPEEFDESPGTPPGSWPSCAAPGSGGIDDQYVNHSAISSLECGLTEGRAGPHPGGPEQARLVAKDSGGAACRR